MKTLHNDAKKRFELLDDNGQMIGFIEYEPSGGNVVRATHTIVSRKAQKQGNGTLLVDALANWARKEGLSIDPACPFVRALWLRQPKKYGDVMKDV